MTPDLTELALAMAVFVAAHMIPSHGGLRRAMIDTLGDWPFRIGYSLLSLGLLVWLIAAYQRAPYVALFEPITFFRHLPMSVMALACVLVASGYSIARPSALVLEKVPMAGGVPGILKITRHPVLIAVVLWALAHMAANGDGAAWILFGSLAGLSALGALHIDQRKRAEGGDDWRRLAAETANIPFLALIQGRTRLKLSEIGWKPIVGGLLLYGALLAAHPYVIGVSPLPLPN